jgi:hypothetical protein
MRRRKAPFAKKKKKKKKLAPLAQTTGTECREQCTHAAKHGNKERGRRKRRRIRRPFAIGPSIPSLGSSVD